MRIEVLALTSQLKLTTQSNFLAVSTESTDPRTMGASYIPWVIGTTLGVIISFFISIAAGLNPSLATSVGLILLRPFSSDYNLIDAGSPPSWNGRRWVQFNSIACGIFSGQTVVPMGNTSNSLLRYGILSVVSWLAWGWRTGLRDAFGFGPITCVSRWMAWAAMSLEALTTTVWVIILFHVYFWWHSRKQALLMVSLLWYLVIMLLLMIRYLMSGAGLRVIFYGSELLILITLPFITLRAPGLEVQNGYAPGAFLCTWIHIVSCSCFQ